MFLGLPDPSLFCTDPDPDLSINKQKGSVVDPYSFFPDPDPEFAVGDQYGSGSGSNTDPGL